MNYKTLLLALLLVTDNNSIKYLRGKKMAERHGLGLGLQVNENLMQLIGLVDSNPGLRKDLELRFGANVIITLDEIQNSIEAASGSIAELERGLSEGGEVDLGSLLVSLLVEVSRQEKPEDAVEASVSAESSLNPKSKLAGLLQKHFADIEGIEYVTTSDLSLILEELFNRMPVDFIVNVTNLEGVTDYYMGGVKTSAVNAFEKELARLSPEQKQAIIHKVCKGRDADKAVAEEVKTDYTEDFETTKSPEPEVVDRVPEVDKGSVIDTDDNLTPHPEEGGSLATKEQTVPPDDGNKFLPETLEAETAVSVAGVNMFVRIFGEEKQDAIQQLSIADAIELLALIENYRAKYKKPVLKAGPQEAMMNKLRQAIEGDDDSSIADSYTTTRMSINEGRRQWAKSVTRLVGGNLPSFEDLLGQLSTVAGQAEPANEEPIAIVEIPKESAESGPGGDESIESLINRAIDKLLTILNIDNSGEARYELFLVFKDMFTNTGLDNIDDTITKVIRGALIKATKRERFNVELSLEEWFMLSSVAGVDSGHPTLLTNKYPLEAPKDGRSAEEIVQTKFMYALLKILSYELGPAPEVHKQAVGDDFLA